MGEGWRLKNGGLTGVCYAHIDKYIHIVYTCGPPVTDL